MMVQAWRKVDFGTGTVTFLDDTQKEDMLQVEYPNGFLLDMGWYQDRYIILVIRDFDWAHPIKRYETADICWNTQKGLKEDYCERKFISYPIQSNGNHREAGADGKLGCSL